MYTFVKCAAAAFATLVSVSASAAATPSTSAQIIDLMNGWFGEGLAVGLNNTVATGCATSPYQFILQASHPAYKQTASLLLAAHATRRPVVIYFDSGNCAVSDRAVILGVRMTDD